MGPENTHQVLGLSLISFSWFLRFLASPFGSGQILGDNINTKNIDEIKLIVYKSHNINADNIMRAKLQNSKSGKQNNKGKFWSNTAGVYQNIPKTVEHMLHEPAATMECWPQQ